MRQRRSVHSRYSKQTRGSCRPNLIRVRRYTHGPQVLERSPGISSRNANYAPRWVGLRTAAEPLRSLRAELQTPALATARSNIRPARVALGWQCKQHMPGAVRAVLHATSDTCSIPPQTLGTALPHRTTTWRQSGSATYAPPGQSLRLKADRWHRLRAPAMSNYVLVISTSRSLHCIFAQTVSMAILVLPYLK